MPPVSGLQPCTAAGGSAYLAVPRQCAAQDGHFLPLTLADGSPWRLRWWSDLGVRSHALASAPGCI